MNLLNFVSSVLEELIDNYNFKNIGLQAFIQKKSSLKTGFTNLLSVLLKKLSYGFKMFFFLKEFIAFFKILYLFHALHNIGS